MGSQSHFRRTAITAIHQLKTFYFVEDVATRLSFVHMRFTVLEKTDTVENQQTNIQYWFKDLTTREH